MKKNVEAVFNKDIQSHEDFEELQIALNDLTGRELTWDFGSGCSAICSVEHTEVSSIVALLRKGTKIGPVRIYKVLF